MERDAVHKAIMSLLRQDVKSKPDKSLFRNKLYFQFFHTFLAESLMTLTFIGGIPWKT